MKLLGVKIADREFLEMFRRADARRSIQDTNQCQNFDKTDVVCNNSGNTLALKLVLSIVRSKILAIVSIFLAMLRPHHAIAEAVDYHFAPELA